MGSSVSFKTAHWWPTVTLVSQFTAAGLGIAAALERGARQSWRSSAPAQCVQRSLVCHQQTVWQCGRYAWWAKPDEQGARVDPPAAPLDASRAAGSRRYPRVVWQHMCGDAAQVPRAGRRSGAQGDRPRAANGLRARRAPHRASSERPAPRLVQGALLGSLGIAFAGLRVWPPWERGARAPPACPTSCTWGGATADCRVRRVRELIAQRTLA